MGCHAGPTEMAGEASPRSAGGCRMRNALELVDVDSDRLEEVLRRAEQSLDEKDAELIRAVFESYAYVTELVEDKNTSIRRLRQLFFGAHTEKTEDVVGPKSGTPEAAQPREAVAEIFSLLPVRHYEYDARARKGVATDGDRAAADEASRKVCALAEGRPAEAPLFMQAARSWMCQKANRDAHDYKFLVAIFEEVGRVSPRWRPHLLAASVHYLHGDQSPDNPVVHQARE